MKKVVSEILSVFLAAAVVMSSFPAQVYAENENTQVEAALVSADSGSGQEASVQMSEGAGQIEVSESAGAAGQVETSELAEAADVTEAIESAAAVSAMEVPESEAAEQTASAEEEAEPEEAPASAETSEAGEETSGAGEGADAAGEEAAEAGEETSEAGEGADAAGEETSGAGEGADAAGEEAAEAGEETSEAGEGADAAGEEAAEAGEGADAAGEEAAEAGEETSGASEGADAAGEETSGADEGADAAGEDVESSGGLRQVSNLELPDADTLFAAHINNTFYGTPTPTDNPALDTLASANMGTRLTGPNAKAYKYLKSLMEEVASGERSSTEFEIPLKKLGLTKEYYTASELGLSSFYYYDEDTICEALYNKTGFNIWTVMRALLNDCPYEAYWFDKTIGYYHSSCIYRNDSDGESYVSLPDPYCVGMVVSRDYSTVASYNNEVSYQTDTNRTSIAANAAANATAIVSECAAYDDYTKLLAYKNVICNLVSYNYSAIEYSNTPYGDPWQLIYVFDGDYSTNVVCEGYAKAFKYLCDQSEFSSPYIFCKTVTGMMYGATGEGLHMWNVVTMNDDKNYLTDVTNCDEGTSGAPDLLFLVGVQGQPDEGYYFSDAEVAYAYDADTFLNWDDEEIALADHNYYFWAHDHEYGSQVITKKPTCTKKGSGYRVCTICGDKQEEAIAALGHTWESEYTVDRAATSTREGQKSIHCSVCGASKSGSERPIARLEKAVSKLTVSGIKNKTYTGKALTQAVVVKDGSVTLTKGVDYTVKYKNNTNAGKASVVIYGKNNYTGSRTVTFTINKQSNAIKAGNVSKTYKTKAQTFNLGATAANGTPTYESDNKSVKVSKAGKVTVKAKFIGRATITIKSPASANYKAATKKITVTVKPTVPALSSVKASGSRKITVKWKKNKTVTGYQIQYCTRSDFKSGAVKTAVKSKSTVKKDISDLKKGKTYYVRIRSYKKVSSLNIWSDWSAAKKVKVK